MRSKTWPDSVFVLTKITTGLIYPIHKSLDPTTGRIKTCKTQSSKRVLRIILISLIGNPSGLPIYAVYPHHLYRLDTDSMKKLIYYKGVFLSDPKSRSSPVQYKLLLIHNLKEQNQPHRGMEYLCLLLRKSQLTTHKVGRRSFGALGRTKGPRQMVELDGIEPTTSCLQSRRSPN